jgi:undecaprenyl-diphosphatase
MTALRRPARAPWRTSLAGAARRREIVTLLAVLLLSGIVWGFAELADEVLEGETRDADEAILLALRTPGDLTDPLGPGWVEELGRDFTALGGVGILVSMSLAVVGYLLIERKRHAALLVVVAVAGGLLISTLLKEGFDRPRPDLVPHGSIVYTASFPSGHSMLSAVVYLTLGALLARVHAGRALKAYFLLVAAILTLLVGVSRVYLGVHWPTDVLAGWAGGAAWAILCWTVALQLQRRGQVEEESEPDASDAKEDAAQEHAAHEGSAAEAQPPR